MKPSRMIASTLALAATLAGSATAGPYHVTIPMPGVTAADLSKIAKALDARFGRSVLEPKIADGVLEFFGGGEGPKDILRLTELQAALSDADFSIRPDEWMLKEQQIGFTLETTKPMATQALLDLLRSYDDGAVEVAGSIVDRTRLSVVADLERKVDLAALRAYLAKHGVRVTDVLWGHWKYGFGIEEHGGHSHENGAVAKQVIV